MRGYCSPFSMNLVSPFFWDLLVDVDAFDCILNWPILLKPQLKPSSPPYGQPLSTQILNGQQWTLNVLFSWPVMVGTALMISLSLGHVSVRHTEAQKTEDIQETT